MKKQDPLSEIEVKLDHKFKDRTLFLTALTHKSFHFENLSESPGHNEKLEFLGDAVIDLVLSELLMEIFPEDEEGALSKKRASLVNETILSQVGNDLDIGNFVLLGKGEKTSGGATKPRLLASTYEALVGAMFLDAGFKKSREIIRTHFAEILEGMDHFSLDYKTELQELVQAAIKVTPNYKVESEEGPSHRRKFEVSVWVKGKKLTMGKGLSKKEAEQEAARLALKMWRERRGGE